MLTTAVQPSRLCRQDHDRHQAHLWTGELCRRRPLSRGVHHGATIVRSIGFIAGRRRRAPNTSGVNHRPTARETTDSRHLGLHLLRHVCWEISTVRSRSPTAPSVPVRPRLVAPGHQSKGEAGRPAFCVARRAEELPHLGTCLPVLPALQSPPPYSKPIGRHYPASSPFSARPRRPRWAPSDISSLHILPHCC
jgi:hypothetical protein